MTTVSSYTDPATRGAHDHVYRHLREEILSGRLAGGSRLKQEELAQRFKLSRMPVRDALLRLHAEGLVSIEPNRSVIVTQLGPSEVQEVFEIRAVLEGLALRLAIPNLNSEAHVEIEELVQRLERVAHEHELWIRRHDEFHEYLNQWSQRPRLLGEIRQVRSAVQPYFRMYLLGRGQPEAGVADHRLIVDAIKRGSAKAAEEAMRRHVLTAAAGVVQYLASRDLDAKRSSEAMGR